MVTVNDICCDREPLVEQVWENSYYWLAVSRLISRTSRSSPQFLRKREAARSLRYVPSTSSANQQSYRKKVHASWHDMPGAAHTRNVFNADRKILTLKLFN